MGGCTRGRRWMARGAAVGIGLTCAQCIICHVSIIVIVIIIIVIIFIVIVHYYDLGHIQLFK